MRQWIALFEEATVGHTVTGHHSGQSDETLYVNDGDNILARLDYSVYEGQPHIQMIQSFDQRKGHARTLVLNLQARYPDEEIDWGTLTPEGAALKHSLTFRTIVDPKMKAKVDLLQRVKAKLDDLKAQAAHHKSEMWNRLWDIERRLEDELEYGQVSKQIVVS